MVVGSELDLHVLEVGRALRAEVHDDVQDRPAGRAHELGLGGGRVLEVHAAQRSLLVVERQVRLRDHRVQAVLGHLFLAERPREEPAGVLHAFELDDEGPFELRFREYHGEIHPSDTSNVVRSVEGVQLGPKEIAVDLPGLQ